MTPEASEVFQVKTKEIRVSGREFTVRPFTFDQRVKIYEMLAEAAALLGGKPGAVTNPQGVMETIPGIIRMIGPRLKDIFAMVLKVEPDWIGENLDAAGEAELIEAVLEVNDVPLYLSRMRQAFGKLRPKLASASESRPGSEMTLAN